MTVYVKFDGKRTWHIVAQPAWDDRTYRDVPTVCGEPSIAASREHGPVIMRGATPDRVCQRCEKRNR